MNDDDKKTMDDVVQLYWSYFERVNRAVDSEMMKSTTIHNVAAHLTLSHFLAKGIHIYSSWFNAVESTRPTPKPGEEKDSWNDGNIP